MKIQGGTPIHCDVLVAGGGAAGMAAAIGAARNGARVVLLERAGVLGGTATAGLAGTVCGLYLRDAAAAKPDWAAGGFPREFAERLTDASDTEPLRLNDGLWVLPYAPWAFARLADDLAHATPGLQVILHATVAGARAENGRVTEIGALAWNEALRIAPAAVVDCTGEATAAALAGAPQGDAGAEQAPAMVFVMENADPGFSERGMLDTLRALRRGIEQGRLPAGCDRLARVPGNGGAGRVVFKLNLAPAPGDRPAWSAVSEWEREGRARVDAIQAFLIGNAGAFKHARLSRTAQLGVRAGRRIEGRARLSEADVLGCAKPADGVARGAWPIEQWRDAPRPHMGFFNERDYYEISLDCLRARGLENLFAAGRCLSATAEALASARVIGTALGTGWAAGTAAAFQADGRALEDAVARIRGEMEE